MFDGRLDLWVTFVSSDMNVSWLLHVGVLTLLVVTFHLIYLNMLTLAPPLG